MQSKVHPTYKTKYRVANWPAYSQALDRRGDVTVWLAPEAVAAWTPRRSGALVHESELARNDPNPQFLHRPMPYDAGLPSPVIRLRMLHAITASVTRPPGERARRSPPMIALYRKKAFSTRACRW